ncbi:hypothetical protein RIF29_22392 [Crotalaria pallida]|uniref:Uncharacterized protein n=1 Tax=Crotalaria pallida TaxID=3830 RepID=A0AAN9FDB0_CROPI
MAFHRSIFLTFMLLLALLVIASATDYGYGPAPKVDDKPKPVTEYTPLSPPITKPDYEVPKPTPETDYTSHPTIPYYEEPKTPYPTKLDYEVPKPKTDYTSSHPTMPDYEVPKLKTPHITIPNYEVMPKTKTPYPTKPDYDIPKSKTDYNLHPTTPNYEVPKPKIPHPSISNYEVPKPKTDYTSHPTVPKYEVPKPKADYTSHSTKSNYEVPAPTPKTNYKTQPTKSDYEVPKPNGKDELSSIIAIQGVVLCKSGSSYFPIQGAVARVTCKYVDEYGYEARPTSVLSHVTDNKGYYLVKLPLAELGSKLKLTECKAYLESSPLETCKVPTDVNYGISGAPLSSYRLLQNNVKLYSVSPFFCTSSPPKTIPNGY